MENEFSTGELLGLLLKQPKDKEYLNQTYNSVHWVSVQVMTQGKEERRRENRQVNEVEEKQQKLRKRAKYSKEGKGRKKAQEEENKRQKEEAGKWGDEFFEKL